MPRPSAEYVAWLEALSANLQDSAAAEAFGELQAIEPPRGFPLFRRPKSHPLAPDRAFPPE